MHPRVIVTRVVRALIIGGIPVDQWEKNPNRRSDISNLYDDDDDDDEWTVQIEGYHARKGTSSERVQQRVGNEYRYKPCMTHIYMDF